MKVLFCLLLTFFASPLNSALSLAAIGSDTRLAAQRGEDTQIVSRITTGKQLSSSQLQRLKQQMETLSTILEQKLQAADQNTQKDFKLFQQKIHNFLAEPTAPLSPVNPSYLSIKSILAEISNNPVLAMTYEETLRLPVQPILATIQPTKGHGAVYRKNDSIQLQVTATRDCYIQVLLLAREANALEDGRIQPFLLYPRKGENSGRMTAGQTLILGQSGELTVQPPYGNDLVLVIAAEHELQPPSSLDKLSISVPLHFDRLLADIYGENIADRISVNSSFFVSQPPETTLPGTRMVLLTEEEAETLRLDELEWSRPPLKYRSIPAGPVIKVRKPTLTDEKNPTIETVTPMNLIITFEENHAPVDMESLQVTAKKGFLSMSITRRVREYINGTKLDARDLDFPKGKFRIQVEIADVEGVISSQEYRLEVRGE